MPYKYKPIPYLSKETIERFWSKVAIAGPDECWLYIPAPTMKYATFSIGDISYLAHRISYAIQYNADPGAMLVCHNCPTGDNPRCQNGAHFFLGTSADNNADMARKGRAASGDKNGSRLYPERCARGLRNGKYTKPECTPRGDRNGSRTHPEAYPRGVDHRKALLTEDEVREIRALRAAGGITYMALARRFGVAKSTITMILTNRNWKHLL